MDGLFYGPTTTVKWMLNIFVLQDTNKEGHLGYDNVNTFAHSVLRLSDMQSVKPIERFYIVVFINSILIAVNSLP